MDLLNHTAHPKLNWRTPFEKAFGTTPDISPYFQFRFWDSVYYYENVSFPNSNEKIGYWLGVTRNCGDALTYYIYVLETHQVIARNVVWSVQNSIEEHPNLRAAQSQDFHEATQPNDEEDDWSIFSLDSNNSNWTHLLHDANEIHQSSPYFNDDSSIDSMESIESMKHSTQDSSFLISQNLLTNTTPIFNLPIDYTSSIDVSCLH